MSEQAPKEVKLSPQETGRIADLMIEFALVPNRRVVLEGTELFLFKSDNKPTENGDSAYKTMVLRDSKDGTQRELAATSLRNGREIVGGEVDFTVIKNGIMTERFYGTNEAVDIAWKFLRELAFRKY